MGELFDWLVERERYVVAITICLVIALVVQAKFCKSSLAPEPTQLRTAQEAIPAPSSLSTADGITAGEWEMTVRKKKGGVQTWTLKLEQDGSMLKGVLNSEGGDLPVSGTINGSEVRLTAKRFGFTLEIPAILNGDTMTGTMRVMTIKLEWTAKRK